MYLFSTYLLFVTGQVVARFRFIPKLDERKFCKPWLWVSPPFGVITPKEKVSVTLTVRIKEIDKKDEREGEGRRGKGIATRKNLI